ncbi:hypothetical protein SAMN04488564_101165 [Lentzea waywayandensis]|uniref:Uncharacterized protein n=1 Tax=Lentzea waywayandensis TaxID=84724 RepID=A0A1I6CRT9_9PSEU|nr:hypothetical protein [Lentzea waywayandensis]SFQ95880.1 hypothetical protein SAMN04488564_101165 [Lentzea waywayandensis]
MAIGLEEDLSGRSGFDEHQLQDVRLRAADIPHELAAAWAMSVPTVLLHHVGEWLKGRKKRPPTGSLQGAIVRHEQSRTDDLHPHMEFHATA